MNFTELGYQLNPQTNVWARPDYPGIVYSDGDNVEQRIATIIEQANDITVLSTELRQHCTDWPSLYHLSGTRANILRPFQDSLRDAEVLEIGGGCGAITRYLGECQAKVLSLEGALRRAAIARSRTRDLPNVTVIADRFDQFEWNQKFDVITLIGVLEYANLFTNEEDPASAMLQRARNMLKPDGKLIIAIENQLGLKYFAGASEDHVGQPMYGIEGRYQKDQPQTFGRKTLSDLLNNSGFVSLDFFLPFPDYKFPVSILTEAGIKNKEFDAAAFAWQSVKRDPQLPLQCSFFLELTWPEIFKNELMLDLANSFLIVASASPFSEKSSDAQELAYHYSTDRRPHFCKETIFRCDLSNAITLSYYPLCQNPVVHITDQLVSADWPLKSAYYKGTILSWEFIRIASREGWTIDEAGAFIKRYISILLEIASKSGNAITLSHPHDRLPNNFFDIVPHNIIITDDGMPVVIDMEWTLSEDVELGWLLFRSILYMSEAMTRFGNSSTGKLFSRTEFIMAVLQSAGYPITEDDISRFIEKEALIQQQVTARSVHEFLHSWLIQSLPTITARRDPQIAELKRTVAERDAQNAELNRTVTERDAQNAELSRTIAERDNHIAIQNNQISAIYNSTSWRLTSPMRAVSHQAKRVRRITELVKPAIRRGGGLKRTLKKAKELYFREGWTGIKRGFRVAAAYAQSESEPVSTVVDQRNYAEWIRHYDTITNETRAAMTARIEALKYKPLISVVMPVYNPKPEWLKKAIDSVRHQIYPHWELCIADDASTDKSIHSILEFYATADARIKVVFREQNGHISAASNSALELATGEWIALLDHDDLLSEHALFHVANTIDSQPQSCLIYSDEDKINDKEERYDPYFKCDWNVDLFYSQNLISHLGVYKTALLRKIGGFRIGFEGSQDYDLALRCIEHLTPDQICHIPHVLYHWRAHAESTAQSGDIKPYAMYAGVNALNDHIQRQGRNAKAELLPFGMYRVRYSLPPILPLVSLIIPTKNGLNLIKQCIESILKKTTYPEYEILIVDNGSDDPAALQYFNDVQSETKIRVLRDDRPFNYSMLNNSAAKMARGEILALINNDIEVISSDWLDEMVSHAMRPDVGAVGARLWYPNETLQHGGVVLGLGGVASHAHRYLKRYQLGYFGRAALIQSYSAMTAACLVIRKKVFEEVGGLNEEHLQVAFNDVDFCLRVKDAGYRNVWTPYAELYHHESATRGHEDTPEKQKRALKEVEYMMRQWGNQLTHDPAYSPNLTLYHEDFSFAWPPRINPSFFLTQSDENSSPPTPSTRIDKALALIDRDGLGLEIGPSHNPIAPKRDGFKVHVLDHVSAEELREKYKGHEKYGVKLENIEEVDFIWEGQPLHQLIGAEACYDWIIASHVIEHFPDLIMFFNECERLLKPNGVLSLIIPDKRYCFDYFNSTTSIGEVLDVFEQKRKRPSPGKVFEHVVNASKRDGQFAWSVANLGELELMHSFSAAQSAFERAKSSNEYIDVHNWRFTPASFRLLLSDLRALGLTQLSIATEFDTVGCEFYVTLNKVSNADAIDRLSLLKDATLQNN